MTKVNLILAFARDEQGRMVVGANGMLPWNVPEEMAHFARTTKDCPVIMGRHTWDALPQQYRPLPHRRNIVMTRNRSWAQDGAMRAESFEHALQYCGELETAWVIGGPEVWGAALPRATGAVVSEIHLTVQGDKFAPELGESWLLMDESSHESRNGCTFSIKHYQKRP